MLYPAHEYADIREGNLINLKKYFKVDFCGFGIKYSLGLLGKTVSNCYYTYMLGTHFRGNAALHIQVNSNQQLIADVLKIMSCIAPKMSPQHGYSLKLT